MFLVRIKRCVALFLVATVVTFLFSACGGPQGVDDEACETSYTAALVALNDKNYEEAYTLLSQVDNYKEAASYLEKFVFRPTEICWEWEGSEVSVTTFTYDERGNCILIADSDGMRESFTYEGVGCPVQCRVSKGEAYSTVSYTYNKNGLPIAKSIENEGDISTVSYEYDKRNRLIKRVHSYDGEAETLTLSYDKKGNCIETSGDYAVGVHVNTFTYDKNGHCIRKVYAAGRGESTFEYDAYGNRVKEVFTPYSEEDGFSGVGTYTYALFYFEDGVPSDWNFFIDHYVYELY